MDRLWVSDERLDELFALNYNVWLAVEPEEIVALVRELQERRTADTMRPEWHHDEQSASVVPEKPTWEEAAREQAALAAASDEALRLVDDAVESDATASATWQAHNSREHKPPKLAQRVKRLRDEVRTLFGAVGDLTTSKYELGDDLIALRERVDALERWRSGGGVGAMSDCMLIRRDNFVVGLI